MLVVPAQSSSIFRRDPSILGKESSRLGSAHMYHWQENQLETKSQSWKHPFGTQPDRHSQTFLTIQNQPASLHPRKFLSRGLLFDHRPTTPSVRQPSEVH